MGKHFIIPLEVYPFDVMVSIGETDEQVLKTLKKYGLDSEPEIMWKYENEITAQARFCLFSNNGGFIRMRKVKSNLDYAFLQHEIFHYTMHIFKILGMEWSYKSDEAYAYMVSYLTEKIYDKL